MTELPRHDDTGILRISLIVAVLIHGALLLSVTFSQPETRAEPIRDPGPRITSTSLPPPPSAERTPGPRKKFERRMPVPFEEAEELVPFEDADPVISEDSFRVDGSFNDFLGTPEAPPSPGPRTPGVGGVTLPRLIAASKVRPRFPEIARVSRSEGTVVLQAVIRSDGTVAEVTILRCDRPGVGFEEAAAEAVMRWRYEPAMLNGRPVDVFFSVRVEFELQ